MSGIRRISVIVTATTLVTALALAGCGGAGAAPSGTAAPQPTATATVAATTTATPQRTVSLPANCTNMSDGPYVQVGGLVFSAVSSAFVATGDQIPQGTANRPFKISTTGQIPNINPTATPTGVSGHGYDIFTVCNLSTQAMALQSVSVRIASFAPYSGALAAWDACKDGFYDANQQIVVTGGCGGSYAANEFLEVNFPGGAGVGDSVTAQVISSSPSGTGDPNPFPRLPLSLAPGHVLTVAANVTTPTAPGTYTFEYGFVVDSGAPEYFGATSPVLYTPITQSWGGQNCTAQAMKSQIPTPAPQGTLYICPPAS